MKKILRIIISIMSIAVIAGYFLPWISLQVSGFKIIEITGFDILKEQDIINKIIAGQFRNPGFYLMLLPLLCIYITIVLLKGWKSFLYIVPAWALFIFYLYLTIDSYKIILNFFPDIKKSKDIINSLSLLKDKNIQLDLGIIGRGLYITIICYIGILFLSFKEMKISGKKKEISEVNTAPKPWTGAKN